MKYLEPSFSTLPPAGADYRDRWDAIFAKKIEAGTESLVEMKDKCSARQEDLVIREWIAKWLESIPCHVIEDWGLNAVAEITDLLKSGEPLPDFADDEEVNSEGSG